MRICFSIFIFLFMLMLPLSALAADTLVASLENYEKEARFLEESINKEREALIQSLDMLINLSPDGKYVDGFLFRLSELLYEKAVIEFSNKVTGYEAEYARFEKGEINTEPVYPLYDFSKVLSVYRNILKRNPDSTMVEQVLYYTGLCYKKADEHTKANQAFEVLVKRYPSGAHYLDALMEMGAYYFNNPSTMNGKGYERAIETYKEVLKYRDSDKFIEALYRLAWSYYMIDKYNEAVTVFRHLIEEIDVAESYGVQQSGMEKNPMFKDEAIEYIAVSLCEVGDLTRVSQFLEMIGNKVYSLLILNRMGTYYEEQMDFESAMGCYRLMLSKYPFYGQVLDGRMGIIRCFERMGVYDSAQTEKEAFFKEYSKGSDWQRKIFEPVWQKRADSLSIRCILSVSQYRFTQARTTGTPQAYNIVLSLNNRLASIYPDAEETYEALWVNALIYEQNLYKLDSARTLYLAISRRPETAHRQQSAINAIAVSQRIEETEKGEEGSVTVREQKIIDACQNYVNLLPENSETIDVAFIPASIYFNRRIFDKALKVYSLILTKIKDPKDPKKFEALLYSGQCQSGLKDFEKAELTFDALYKIAPEGKYKDEAKTRRVESAFQHAEVKRHAKDFRTAATLFLSIEGKYTDFINMDIVVFNAADAYERLGAWKDAAEVYRRMQQKFPYSKLADGALFNGATCFENDSSFAEAIVCYELILANYPSSVKSRDALYNIGLCYEKMKAYDKMAEAQERYAEAYPDSKEVEALLFSSAKYFLEGNRPDRARRAFENFVRRFPGSNGEIEARYRVCELMLKENDARGAESAFETLIQRNEALRPIGRNNDYFAGEAAFQVAEMIRSRFEIIEFKLPAKTMEASQKEKADLLRKTIESYTRVVQLKSERLFEAAYNIGRSYTLFADAYVNQERDTKLEGTKLVVAERDLQLSAVTLYEKCIEPHFVNIGFAKALPSDTMLKPEQRKYVDLSRKAIISTLLSLGSFYVKAADALYGAPVPPKIRKMPVQYYLYRQKLAETIQPIYVQAFEKNLATKAKVVEKGFGDSVVNIINDSVASVLFKRGQIFYELSGEMLNNPAIPPEIKGDEREETVFQIEDVAFEIQDKALRAFEEGYDYIQREAIEGVWRRKILEVLKQLDPQTYTSKEVLDTVEISTGSSWMTRPDSILGWNKLSPYDSAWTKITSKQSEGTVITPIKDKQGFFKNQFLLSGKVMSAMAYISSGGRYRFSVNGIAISMDTSIGRSASEIDSFDIKAQLTGGDNALALSFIRGEGGIDLKVRAVLDTSLRFTSNMGLVSGGTTVTVDLPIPKEEEKPPVVQEKSDTAQKVEKVETVLPPADTTSAKATPAPAPVAVKEEKPQEQKVVEKRPAAVVLEQFKNYEEYSKVISEAKQKNEDLKKEVRSTQTRIRSLKYRLTTTDESIKATQNDIQVYRKILESKSQR